MVRTNSKKHSSSSVTDLKAARIERNLKKLAELVNSSPETKERTMEYLKMAKTAAERQAEYKATRKQINFYVNPLAYQSLADSAAEQGKTKLEILESLLLGNKALPSNNSELQKEIDRLKAELAKANATIIDLEIIEREYIRSMKQKLLKLSPAELALFYDKLKEVINLEI